MAKNIITLDTEKFKEILLYSWELLPVDKQEELREIGIFPKKELREETGPVDCPAGASYLAGPNARAPFRLFTIL
jgi:hypothetical protein